MNNFSKNYNTYIGMLLKKEELFSEYYDITKTQSEELVSNEPDVQKIVETTTQREKIIDEINVLQKQLGELKSGLILDGDYTGDEDKQIDERIIELIKKIDLVDKENIAAAELWKIKFSQEAKRIANSKDGIVKYQKSNFSGGAEFLDLKQ